MVQRKQILDVLRQGIDPELGASVMKLGLIREIRDGESRVTLELMEEDRVRPGYRELDLLLRKEV
jgi:metal-sulfur cluster biosynthetic enzyme